MTWFWNAFWIELRLGSVLDVLVLKNDAECTSQRVKRTSGARVLIFFCDDRSLDRPLARSLGRSPARSLARSVARSIACWLALERGGEQGRRRERIPLLERQCICGTDDVSSGETMCLRERQCVFGRDNVYEKNGTQNRS